MSWSRETGTMLACVLLMGLTAARGQTEANVWGGEHVEMETSDKGASLEFDCATGTIEEPVGASAQGRFRLKGTYTREHGGPTRDGDSGRSAAVYVGVIQNDSMELTILLANDEKVGPFTLKRGKAGAVVKCR